MSVGFASLGVAIIIAHMQGKLRQSIEDEKNKEQDSNVLSIFNAYLNFIINLRYVRQHQRNLRILQDDDPHDQLSVIKFNLEFNVNSTIRKAENIIRLLDYNLKYFPTKAYRVYNWSDVVSENIINLQNDLLDDHALFQIEHALDVCIGFLEDYEALAEENTSGLEYYLPFYKYHHKAILRNGTKHVTDHIHPVYVSINSKYF